MLRHYCVSIYFLESEIFCMTFAFQNPNASITSLSFAGDHPDADAVKRAIRSYFTSKDARIFLGNAYTIITFFAVVLVMSLPFLIGSA